MFFGLWNSKYVVDHKIRHFACERDCFVCLVEVAIFIGSKTITKFESVKKISHKQNVLFYGLLRI